MNPSEIKEFRHPLGFVAAIFAASIVFTILIVIAINANASNTALGILVFFAILTAYALTESIRTRVLLGIDTLDVSRLSGRRLIRRRDIEEVTWKKGSGAAVRTKSKKWIKIPPIIGYNSQSMSNSIRAWLMKGPLP